MECVVDLVDSLYILGTHMLVVQNCLNFSSSLSLVDMVH